MSASDTRVFTAQVPVLLADQVDALAARLAQSRGWIVKQALLRYVELEERQHRMTAEGLADVDAGLGVSHAQVKAWAASLATDQPLPLPSCK
jgi:predicted transcriptional regulator